MNVKDQVRVEPGSDKRAAVEGLEASIGGQLGRRELLGLMIPLLLAPTRCVGQDKDDPAPFTFVQWCDPQIGFGGYEHDVAAVDQAVRQINELKPDFVMICGDLVDNKNEKSFADVRSGLAKLKAPYYCLPGNHDIGNVPTAQTLAKYRKLFGQDYYTFEHKGYAFVVLNTQTWKAGGPEDEVKKQDEWLQEAFAKIDPKTPVFVAQHYPLHIKKADEPEEYFNLAPEKRMKLLNLFKAHNVVAVLAGHTHRTILNEWKGIRLVNGEVTCRNFDHKPLGFRLWHVNSPDQIEHELVQLGEIGIPISEPKVPAAATP